MARKLLNGETRITAESVIRLLEERHTEDVFVSECKSGPTQGCDHLRLDGWAMRKSWSNPIVTGYEVKVSRSDFVADDKWHLYLNCCNAFYFVCPHELIRPKELPADVGLIYVSRTGSRLFTKKKAVNREVEIPESLFRYILMCRVKVTREHVSHRNTREFWQQWLRDKKLDRDFGWRVGGAIGETIRKQINEVQEENRELKSRIDQYEDMRALLRQLGVDPNYFSNFTVKRRLEEINRAVPRELWLAMDGLEERLREMRNELQRIEPKEQAGETLYEYAASVKGA